MLSNFDQLDLHNQNSCCIRKSMMEHLQKPDSKSDQPMI